MSQPSVTAFFNTRKRRASEDIRSKSDIISLEREQSSDQKYDKSDNPKQNVSDESDRMVSPKVTLKETAPIVKDSPRAEKAVRNIHFDSPKADTEKVVKTTKARIPRSRRLSSVDSHQVNIRENLQKMGAIDVESGKVSFEKKVSLSPKKLMTPKKSFSDDDSKYNTIKEEEEKECESLIPGSETPTKISSGMERLATENLSLIDIKNRINKSSRLLELKASIARFKSLGQKLKELQKKNDVNQLQTQKFEKIKLEISTSLRKTARSSTKALSTSTKSRNISEATSSPQKKTLLEPKDVTLSPVTCSPIKKPAYRRHIAENGQSSLILPYNYRVLAEMFRCVETVSAMLYNRNELITFDKLKPAVQKLLKRNFTQDYLAQIKTIYPDAYTYRQEKHRNFGSVSKTEGYELVLTPTIELNNGRNTPDPDDISTFGSSKNMGPTLLLERRRKFYNTLLERVKNEHEKFLLNLKTPMVVEKEKIMRWHPEFDVEACAEIEKAELPQPLQADTAIAKDVLDKVKSSFDNGSRMRKALQRLAEAKMTSKSASPQNSIQDSTTQITESNIPKVNISIVDTPPATPTTTNVRQNIYLTKVFKGIPKSLLEKIRAKKAAKVLEMTRIPSDDKEATLYAKLPELAKTLRYIYISDKKDVLPMETVIQRLDNSLSIKLTPNEMDEHLRLLCKLLPTWTSMHNVRDIDYMRLDRNADIVKVMRRLKILANDKYK